MRCCIQHTALLLLNSQLILNMILSVVIPVYNVERYVERCIRSCANQNISTSDYEIIVVNDGSKDNSLQIVKTIASEYENIRVISQENKGLSAARNVGMKESNGDYIMFVDSDDWIEENCFERIIDKLKKERPDCMVIGAVVNWGTFKVVQCEYSIQKPISGKELLKRGVPHCAPFAIWNKYFLNNNNLMFVEGIFHEDAEFTPKAYFTANIVSFLDGIVYNVYHNPNSITQTVNIKKSHDLVKTICPSLFNFSRDLPKEDKVIFDDIISLCLNNALYNTKHVSEEQQGKLNDEIYKNKFLYRSLISSSKLKYVVEGVLFTLFPKHSVRIYKLMSLFKTK